MTVAVMLVMISLGSYPDTISCRVTFSESQLLFEEIQGYDFVRLVDALFITEPGYPALPRKSLIFVIPAGSCISDIEYSVEDSVVIDSTFSIWPAQPAVPISWEDSIPEVDPDSVIYSRITNWPAKVVQGSELGTMDVTELARVDVFPLAWNPGSETLTLRETIEFEIILADDSIDAPSSINMTHTAWNRRIEMLSELVVNDEDIEDYSTSPNLIDEDDLDGSSFPVAVDCVIITRAAWADYWDPLVDWNIKRGVFTEVLTLQEIDNGAGTYWAEGADWLETIRNCIRWLHEQRSALYILIGTDATAYGQDEPGENEVPMRLCKVWIEGPQVPGCYTDWYYACLDDNLDWDTDDDGVWGEYYPPPSPNENDLMDLIPDVAVGRIPVHSGAEARDAARWAVSYQKYDIAGADPGADLLVVSACVIQGDFPPTWKHLEEIISVVPAYVDKYWLAEDGNNIPFSGEISPDDVLNHLDGTAQGGGYYRVNFGGHGGPDWIGANPVGYPSNEWKIWSDDLRDLSGDEGNYCTGWAFNCVTGNFTYPTNNKSIVETWLGTDEQETDAPLGPVYVGNTHWGWNAQASGGSTSHKLNRWFLDAMYNTTPSEGACGAGELLDLAKVTYAGEYLAGYPFEIPDPVCPGVDFYEPMWDLKVCNISGDPALPLWRKEPLQWVSSYPGAFECPGNFTLQVETSGEIPIPGVRVCLMMEAHPGYEIYARGYTDSSGEFTTYLDPSFTGTMYVTLTSAHPELHNLLIYKSVS